MGFGFAVFQLQRLSDALGVADLYSEPMETA